MALSYFQWQVMYPHLVSVTSYGLPDQILMTSLGHPNQVSMTSLGQPNLVIMTIGTRIFKKKSKKEIKMIFSKIFTMLLFIVILRCFIFVYVKMSRQCRVSSIQFNASNWHERSALQSVAVRRSTGNDVSGHYFHHSFLFISFFSPPSSPFLIEGVLGSKNLYSKSWRKRQKAYG